MEALLADPARDPETMAGEYLNEEAGFPDRKAVLDGACQILMETWAEDAQLSGQVREWLWQNALLKSNVIAGKGEGGREVRRLFRIQPADTQNPVPPRPGPVSGA